MLVTLEPQSKQRETDEPMLPACLLSAQPDFSTHEVQGPPSEMVASTFGVSSPLSQQPQQSLLVPSGYPDRDNSSLSLPSQVIQPKQTSPMTAIFVGVIQAKTVLAAWS